MLDCIIIGGGPAGISAGVNLKIRNKNFILLAGTEKVTGLMKAPQIDNYLGLHKISGKDLLNIFKKHALEMEVDIRNEKVVNILSMGDFFMVNTGSNFYESKSIILAIGHAKPNYIEGEKEYLGRGVGYCATCDGPLYKGKHIAIISENEEGEEEAKFLSEICSEVYYIPNYRMHTHLLNNVKILQYKPIAILGDGNKVTSIKFEGGEKNIDAVFIIRNVIPVAQLLEGLEIEEGSIKVDKHMATSIPGVFACGDCIGKPYQLSKAVGEGNVAALSAVKYLDSMDKS